MKNDGVAKLCHFRFELGLELVRSFCGSFQCELPWSAADAAARCHPRTFLTQYLTAAWGHVKVLDGANSERKLTVTSRHRSLSDCFHCLTLIGLQASVSRDEDSCPYFATEVSMHPASA